MAIPFSGDLEVADLIPFWLFEESSMSAVEQIHANYGHGGGWRGTSGFSLIADKLIYPGDPAMTPKAEGKLRDERVLIYDHGWVAVVQTDGTFRVARID